MDMPGIKKLQEYLFMFIEEAALVGVMHTALTLIKQAVVSISQTMSHFLTP